MEKKLLIYLFALSWFGLKINAQTDNSTCATASYLCDPNLDIEMISGSGDAGEFGSLGNCPDPKFYIFQVQKSGVIQIAINIFDSTGTKQLNGTPLDGVPSGINYDIDYGFWGPYDSEDLICNNNIFPFQNYDDDEDNPYWLDVSYESGSSKPFEIIGTQETRSNPVIGEAGKFYLLLICNYGPSSLKNTHPKTQVRLTATPNMTAELQVGFSLPDIVEYQGKDPFPISLPASVTGNKFLGSGITDTINGIFDPCLAEGLDSYPITVEGEAFGCPDTTTFNISLCSSPDAMSCISNFVLPLGDSCTALLNKCMVLLGDCAAGIDGAYGPTRVYASLTDIPGRLDTVKPEDAIVAGEGNWMYGVYYEAAPRRWELYCWGNFITEDKIDPSFVGDTTGLSDDPATVLDESRFQQYGTYKEIYYAAWEDSLNALGTTFRPGLWSCYQDVSNPLDSSTWPNDLARRYDTLSFTISSGNQILTIFAASQLNTNTLDSAAGFDPTIALYRGSFDPSNPCENLVGYAASSFIPNPLAGLGFSNTLENSSINGADQDGGDVFAPWLKHAHPISRMDFKAQAGDRYTLVITHKDGPALQNARYNVYFLLNDYKSNSGRIVTNLPGAVYPDSLGVDTAFAYYDFLCYDLETLMLKNKKTYRSDASVKGDRYFTGGNIWNMSKYLGHSDPGFGYSVANRAQMNEQWRKIGHALFGVHGMGTFIDLNQGNIYPDPGHPSITTGPLSFNFLRNRSQAGDVNDTRTLLDTLLRDYAFAPMVLENCGVWEVNAIDSYREFGDCGIDIGGYTNYAEGKNIAGIITRTWVVSDGRNKTDLDTAYTQLIFRNPTLYDVRLPHYTVTLDCNQVTGEELPSPDITGYPFVSTLTGFVDLTPTSPVCNLAAGYEDKAEVTNCASNKEFRREWTVYDWCRPGTTVIYNQVIRVGDWTKPTFTAGSTGYQSVGFSAQECSGNVSIKRGVATDDCSETTISIWVYEGTTISLNNEVAYSGGQLGIPSARAGVTASIGSQGVLNLSGLSQGQYTTRWVAKDVCGNSDTTSSTFTITDNISPSCVIDDLRTITLTDFQVGGNSSNSNPRGEAYLTADRLDEGSWDNCSEVTVQVRRMTTTGMTAWADQVGFTCEDEGDSVLVEIIARAGSDSTICWTYIKVEDKTIPECREIGTVNMLCVDLPSGDLNENSSVWNQFFSDSITVTKTSVTQLCNIEFDANIETEVKIDQCGYGWVNRYYRIYRTIDTKEYADTCRMSIVFSEDHNYWVTFPADEMNAECGRLEEVKVTFNEGGCDLVTISKNDQKFDATADECYKILRTYRVINWCEYDGGEEAYKVERSDWNRDGVMGDATTLNVKYRQGVQHEYWDYQNGNITVVGAPQSLNPTGSPQSDADRRDTVYRVGLQTAEGVRAYWESAAPVSSSAVTTALMNNGTVMNIRNYVGLHPTPVSTMNVADYIPQGFFEYTQHLKVYDKLAPELEVLTNNLVFASYSNDSDNGCPAPVSISVQISDDCTTDVNELVVRDVLLDANNDDAGSITFLNNKYDASSASGTTLFKAEYSSGTLTISSTGLPQGEHKFTMVAADGCGNVRTQVIIFEVVDKKGPAPICIEGFAVELMPTHLIHATDFVVNKPIDDCNGDSGAYLITRMRNTDGSTKTTSQVVATAATETSIILTCADRALNQPIHVAVIATDGVGNKDYCVTTITVQDNVTPCAAGATQGTIAGLITTEENHAISGVEVSLNASSSKITAIDGGFFFSGLALGGDYSIAPKKDAGYLNGLTTYDIIMITKHLLGEQLLNSPYKLIAADVNKSGSISTYDIILIRKMLLGLEKNFVNNTSWRFVPANYTFPVASNPWSAAFPEVLNINNLAGSVNGDFVAIKVGDVNNSAVIDVQPRSNATFAMNVEDISIKAGNEYTVNFTSNATDVEGFQMALSHIGLELVDIVEGIAKAENFGTIFTGEGVILTSWNGTAANGNLFGLVFRATADSKLSEALSLTSRHINAEAYNNAGEVMNVTLNFNSGAIAEAPFELKQNMPNPFKGETMIGFNLAEASKATLTINDVTGRVLKVVRGDFAKGANQISINSKDLPASGVLYYTLTAGEYTATKKMIIIQ